MKNLHCTIKQARAIKYAFLFRVAISFRENLDYLNFIFIEDKYSVKTHLTYLDKNDINKACVLWIL